MPISKIVRFSLLSLLFNIGLISTGFATVYVQDFSPQGQVKTTNQATAVFSEDMVKLGDTDAPAPFSVDCSIKGKGRWVDTKTWRYQLTRDLQSGERCRFTLKPAFKSINKSTFGLENATNLPRYEVFTAGPWIARILPDENSSIEENQHFFIDTSAKVKPESVLKHAWCEVEGVGERIPVKLLSQEEVQKVAEKLPEINTQAIGLYCQQKLPAGAKAKLVWGQGIESILGGKTQQDEEKAFKVRLPFRAKLTCEREKPNAPCSALSDIKLLFSDQISIEFAEKIQLVNQQSIQYARDVSPQRRKALIALNAKQYYLKNALINQNHLDTIIFKGPFNPNTLFNIQLPSNFTDLSGRVLSNANSFPLKTKVGALPPLAKFSADFGILELKEGGVLPVTLRNVESKVAMRVFSTTKPAEMLAIEDELNTFERQTKEIIPNKAKLAQRSVEGYEGEDYQAQDYQTQDYQPRLDYLYPRELSFLKDKPASSLPKLSPKQAFEVIGIPLQKPGFYIVEIESKLLGTALLSESKPLYVRTRALVTDMAVHFKKGGENSLVWVTSLSTGKPVNNADVTLYDCNNAPIWQAKTNVQGLAMYEQELPEMRNCSSRYSYVATATKGNDFSFVQSDWQNGIEAWRFNVDTYSQIDSPKIHTVLDRTLLRAGETVSMKYIARVPNYQGYAYPNAQNLKQPLPDHATIELIGGDFTLDIPLSWDTRGVATSTWQIPQDANIGSYSIKVGSSWRDSAQFRVSEFRLPAFKGSVSPIKNNVVFNHKAPTIPFNLSLAYLNGGGASGQQVSISALLTQAYPQFANYNEFSFSEQEPQSLNALLADKTPITLNKQGIGKVDIPIKKVDQPAHLATEMTFTDPNGEIQTIHGSVEIWPASLVVGLQIKDWAGLTGTHKLQAVVLNTDGKPQANVQVKIEGTRHWEYVHRKRVIGGFYSYETDSNNDPLGQLCEGKTNAQGFFNCEVTVKDAGEIKLVASIKDSQGNTSLASSGFYSSESGDIWFGQTDEDRMEVIPEKREYQPGEIARFQVHSPFYNATALIAVEREGVLQTFVQPLQRKNATVEIPIAKNWGPNVFVSVLAVRGRLTSVPWYTFFQWGWRNPSDWYKAHKENVPAPTAMVDLARPSFKFGLTKIAVGTSGFKLKVAVSTDKKIYQPRDKAKVSIQVTLPNGKPAPAGSEVVLAAVDKALLELNSNPTWALLDDMQQQRAYLMETASAQMQVVGKRHFGKKALPAGGGGGNDLKARELFNTLLYWNPRVKLDKNGKATVSVPLNDSLTAFKLVAIADVNADLFGTGEIEIVSRQDLQMTSGLPPMVREGDVYRAMLMLRNTTENAMQLRINGKAGTQDLASQSILLAAGEAKELAWQLKVADDLSAIPWQIEAIDAKGKVQDRLRFTQKVLPKTPVTVQQANFMQLTKDYNVETALPEGAIAGKGGLNVLLTAKLADQTAGIERYFNEYPYSCLEQKTSIATGLQDKARWADIVANLSSYVDSQGFLQYFPGMVNGSESLTAYVMSMAYENNIALPADVESKMQQALLGFVEGRTQPAGAWYWGNNQYLKERRIHALAALSYAGNVDTRVLSAFEFKPIQMATTTLIDWLAIYTHLPKADNRAVRMQQIERELRNRMQNVGGRLIFTTEASDIWWWAMVDGEVNATRLVSLLMQNPAWQKDMPALLRGAILRQQKGHWQTTVSNAWGRLALQKFGLAFERETVTGVTTVMLDANKKQYDWAKASILESRPAEIKQPNQPMIRSKEAVAANLFLPWAIKQKTQQFSLQHIGTGKPWINTLVTAAIPAKTLENGYKITRTITAIEQKLPSVWSRGDVLRIRIDIDSSQDMSWVALSDPIPGGASILGNTARDSAIAQADENTYDGNNRAYPSYTERGLSFFRAYYEFAPKGHFWVEYTIRLNNPGTFNLPPTRVEAMYAPELFGQLPNAQLTVQSVP